MATSGYLAGRKVYRRPQAMLWSDAPPTIDNGFYVPQGNEVNGLTAGDDFIVLSDHSRKDISFKPERIENRKRMINGRMRSYHIVDKLTISTSWDMLPSRAFSGDPQFNATTGLVTTAGLTQYTVDGGAGGNELLDWYNSHTGSFYVFLAYDKKSNFTSSEYNHLGEYNEVLEMFISSFEWNVVKRGGTNFDFWNVSVTLEEV